MKPINIFSLLQAKATLSDENYNIYKKYYGFNIKKAEINDLEKLANTLRGVNTHIGSFNNFYVGYKIPQIGKEFDLLRFGQQSIIDIEIKSIYDPEKVRMQLQQNLHYLGFTGLYIYACTFVSSTGEVYTLANGDQLSKVNPDSLAEIITNHVHDERVEPDALFKPSDYLVSPFNSTDKFIKQKYFLTQQQKEIKNLIMNAVGSKHGPLFVGISGSAGTGKTLLTYDIARRFKDDGLNILLIHCGQLNQGHYALIEDGWNICQIKDYPLSDLIQIDAIIIDEAQRIRHEQFDSLVSHVTLRGCILIFSFDASQTLSKKESNDDIAGKIGAIASEFSYKLSTKIRTNKEISDFTTLLFNSRDTAKMNKSENIQINYFNNLGDAKAYLYGLNDSGWEVLRFTPSQFNREHHQKYYPFCVKTSHEVIGQEFDSVAIAVDNFFKYNDNGDLSYSGNAYYESAKMLFQNITRARRRLNLVIIDNQEVLHRCLSILDQANSKL
jgi:hypothetical protein